MAVGQSTPAIAGVRRRNGRYYTPRALARFMVDLCLESGRRRGRTPAPTILDPACGDGVFLISAWEHLTARRAAPAEATRRSRRGPRTFAGRLKLLRECLYGVDNDRSAVETLRASFWSLLAPPANREDEVRAVLARNFRVGESLTGRGFDEADQPLRSLDHADADAPPLDWPSVFPHIAAEGGFDIVLGNPPYHRERSGREVLAALAETPLGRRWRQARMDLWHYFLHRALDHVRPGGQVCFLVNRYWTSSAGASRLRQRLASEATVEDLIELGAAPVFPGVSGHHQVIRMTRGDFDRRCRVWEWKLADWANVAEPAHGPEVVGEIARHELFDRGHVVVHGRNAPRHAGVALSEHCEVRQGIAENPPRVTVQIAQEWPGEMVCGEGVFVLTEEECSRLDLSPAESRLLVPYYAAADLDRYRLPSDPSSWLLYLTRNTAPSLQGIPRIAAHLKRFQTVLKRRREVAQGRLAWWHLHWPREQRLFTSPRVLAAQMGRHPRFVAAAKPTYVNFSVNVVVPKPDSPWATAALSAVLNSQIAADWFERYAKRRGVRLDISGGVLSQFPLPVCDEDACRRLAELAALRVACEWDADGVLRASLEEQIDACVGELYSRSPA